MIMIIMMMTMTVTMTMTIVSDDECAGDDGGGGGCGGGGGGGSCTRLAKRQLPRYFELGLDKVKSVKPTDAQDKDSRAHGHHGPTRTNVQWLIVMPGYVPS